MFADVLSAVARARDLVAVPALVPVRGLAAEADQVAAAVLDLDRVAARGPVVAQALGLEAVLGLAPDQVLGQDLVRALGLEAVLVMVLVAGLDLAQVVGVAVVRDRDLGLVVLPAMAFASTSGTILTRPGYSSITRAR